MGCTMYDREKDADSREHLAIVLMNVVTMNHLDLQTLGLVQGMIDRLDCDSKLKDVVTHAIHIEVERRKREVEDTDKAIAFVQSELSGLVEVSASAESEVQA